MDISFDVVRNSSVKDALHKFFQPEVLDGNNKYKCEKKLVAARKQMAILQAPNVLVIQLKRFEGIFGSKIDKDIAFEDVLVISNRLSIDALEPNLYPVWDLHPDYKLFATIVHIGYSPESGHYYAYVKEATGQWYCCNDSFVTQSSLQEVLSGKVYILFFSRMNQRPSSNGTDFASNGVKASASNGTKPCIYNRTKACISSGTKSFNSNGIKSCISNGNGHVNGNCNGRGNGIFKSQKPVHSEKEERTKLMVKDSLMKTSSTLPKVERVQMKFSFGTSGSKRVSATSEAKPNMLEDQAMMKSGEMRHPNYKEGHESKTTLLLSPTHDNCLGKDKKADFNNSASTSRCISSTDDKKTSFPNLSLQNSFSHGSSAMNSELIIAKNHESNGVSSDPANSRAKRKYNNGSIMLSEPFGSSGKLQEFHHFLQMEAFSDLRSYGWSDEVYRFMHARKKMHMFGDSSQLRGTELKKKLIAEAKSKFLTHFPESLKEKLVEMLISFSQIKQAAADP